MQKTRTLMSLKTARQRRKLTMDRLAVLAGINKATISRLESGDILNPSHRTVQHLEAALRLRPGQLAFDHELAS